MIIIVVFQIVLPAVITLAVSEFMRKKGWILLLVLLGVAFLMSCSKDTEPDEAKGELVRIEREGCQAGILLF